MLVTLPRCPATLMLCEGIRHWGCRVCRRHYRGTPPATQAGSPALAEAGGAPDVAMAEGNGAKGGEAAAGGGALPTCIFCGTLLGPLRPQLLLTPPCG
jgi:hypothetical protein